MSESVLERQKGGGALRLVVDEAPYAASEAPPAFGPDGAVADWAAAAAGTTAEGGAASDI